MSKGRREYLHIHRLSFCLYFWKFQPKLYWIFNCDFWIWPLCTFTDLISQTREDDTFWCMQWHQEVIAELIALYFISFHQYERKLLEYELSGYFRFLLLYIDKLGRLLLRTPGPVPFGTCICSNVETILSWTCHVYGPFEFRTSLGTSILLNTPFKQYLKRYLKLYCRYLYISPYMINRIWSLKQLWLQVNGHAWFHLHGHRWPVRNGEGAKIQNENICLQRDSNPHRASPRQESLRPLGHAG